tara:strand:+ start:622 stop:1359 length:738 start_codon:yes stop_codon:yes gene_type:complete
MKESKVNGILKDNYKIIWHEDFINNSLDTAIWNIEIRKPGWVNNELQAYTKKLENIYIDNNNLIIEAIKEKKRQTEYTSGRLNTSNKFNFKYGRIEVKAKVPKVKGAWPAIWLLSETISEEGWPHCGEIDIMEHINTDDIIYGTIHTKEYNHMNNNQIGGSTTLKYLDSEFNVFGLEWDRNTLVWFINNKEYFRINKNEYFENSWPFDKNYFLIINQAIGGFWPGEPDSTFTKSKFIIDWIKVYQ